MFKNLLIFFLFLISFFSLILNFHLYRNRQNQNIVIEVADGDTFQLKSGERIRLMGVDAPEYNRCGGKEARKILTDLILNKHVNIKEEQKETYGRSLALVYQNNVLINEIILKQGWGVPNYRKNSQRDKLTEAYHYAKNNRLGIFSLCKELPNPSISPNPSNPSCNIKGNIDKNTYKKFYHFLGCKQYNQITIDKDIGEQYFCTEQQAIQAGFTKASGCP